MADKRITDALAEGRGIFLSDGTIATSLDEYEAGTVPGKTQEPEAQYSGNDNPVKSAVTRTESKAPIKK